MQHKEVDSSDERELEELRHSKKEKGPLNNEQQKSTPAFTDGDKHPISNSRSIVNKVGKMKKDQRPFISFISQSAGEPKRLRSESAAALSDTPEAPFCPASSPDCDGVPLSFGNDHLIDPKVDGHPLIFD
jgi:hypothetical protein